jgi:subfamily B ATP-binding cassette protein HlyB/CyaB
MYFGALLVIESKLTVGQLIAFNMLAGQVAQPVMRLSQLWIDFQQTGISMQRLADILNARSEHIGKKSALPRLSGRIIFDQVLFRYRPDGREALKPGRVGTCCSCPRGTNTVMLNGGQKNLPTLHFALF